MRLCRTDCLHRRNVLDYVAERDAQQVRAEAVTGGYAAETTDFFTTTEEKWTFKRWLTTHAQRGYDWLGELAGPVSAPAFVAGGLDIPPEV